MLYRINFCITLRVYVKIIYTYIYQKSKEQRRNGFGVFYFFLHYHKCYPALDLHTIIQPYYTQLHMHTNTVD